MLDVKSVRNENSIGFIGEEYDIEFDEAFEENLLVIGFTDGKLSADTSTLFGPDEVELTKSQTFELFLTMRDYFKDEVWASDFKKYKRTNIAEMRKVTNKDIICFQMYGVLYVDFNEYINYFKATDQKSVSISDFDLENGSPKIGDMIARNPDNHKDSWLVAKEYFEDNFEIIQ